MHCLPMGGNVSALKFSCRFICSFLSRY